MRYVFGTYTLALAHYELRQGGRLVQLEPRVFDLLAYFVQHPGRTVTTDELLEQLYPRQFVPVDRLTNAVAQARKALDDTGQTQRYIQTVRRRGYRFIASVEEQCGEGSDVVAPDTLGCAEKEALDRTDAIPFLPSVQRVPLSTSPPAQGTARRSRAVRFGTPGAEGDNADPGVGDPEPRLLVVPETCAGCNFTNPVGVQFCIACGMPLTHRCPRCGAEHVLQAQFCGGCGSPLAGRPASPPPPRLSSAAPSHLHPVHLAEKILTSQSALEGERKQVTVLFADLQGTMEGLADCDPEETQRLLDPALKRMIEAVHRYEGTVTHLRGDGLMALFGAPLAHEDHAVRGCYAALAMQEGLRHAHGIEVPVRVALNSGEVVVRAIGNGLHMEYAAIGHTIYLAARMEEVIPPGSIWLTAETFRLVDGFVQVTPLSPGPLKGVSVPVAMFQLIGAAPTRTRLQAAATRVLTPFPVCFGHDKG